MTNEAAIEVICDLIAGSGRQMVDATDHELPDIQDTMDALVMAVRALKHEDADRVKANLDADRITINPDADSDWIWASGKTPRIGEKVLVTIKDESGDHPRRYVDVGWYLDGFWIIDNEYGFNVISWKPLPEEPDKRKEEPMPIPW